MRVRRCCPARRDGSPGGAEAGFASNSSMVRAARLHGEHGDPLCWFRTGFRSRSMMDRAQGPSWMLSALSVISSLDLSVVFVPSDRSRPG